MLTLVLCAVLVSIPGSHAAFTARVVNTTTSLTTAPYFTCQAAAVGDGAYYAYPLDDANPRALATARDVSGGNRAGTYQTLAQHSTSSPCTRDGGGSTTFNGSSNYVTTPNQLTNPQTFSVEVWFRTQTASGVLMGFSNSLLTLIPTSWDRILYLNTGGKLVFGVKPGTTNLTIVSPSSYTDNAWHQVVVTLGSNGTIMYVDGTSVVSSGTTSAQSYNGYWKIGYTYLLSWPGAGSSYYFNGQLGYACVYTSQLSATTVAAHYAAGV